MLFTHAVVHENGNELAYSRDHAEALILEGLSIGWRKPHIVKFETALTEEAALNLLKSLER